MDSAHLGKMTKEGQPKKLSLKKVRIRSLEGREIKCQPFKDTQEWKVSKKHLGKQQQKKKTMRNKEMINYQSGWHNVSFGTQGSKGGELVVPRNPRMTL